MAAAVERGLIGAEHVKIIRRFFRRLPSFVDYDTRDAAEAQLAELACGLKPEELRQVADRLAILLDQDGDLTDADRARRRFLTIDKQQSDGMSDIRGRLDPEGRAALEAVFAKWAAPGMCNPEDPSPCLDGEPSKETGAADMRSQGQRNHDALTAMARSLLASGQLGSHNGLPVTMVISTTLQDLESGKGHAVTGGGSLLPMSQVIRQAAAAHHYLAVVDKHTEQPLYLGRSRRLASAAQRIVLYAKDRGCTAPGCTAPAYHSQVHHASADWADGGQTNITDESLACGKDNRKVKPGGWRTRKLIDSARLRGVRPGQERLVDPIRAFTPASPRRSRGLPRQPNGLAPQTTPPKRSGGLGNPTALAEVDRGLPDGLKLVPNLGIGV